MINHIWILYIEIASISVAFFNYWQSISELNLKNIIIALIGFISIGSMYWLSFNYSTSKNFLICWLLSFVITAIVSVLIDIFIANPILNFSYNRFIVGLACIICGLLVTLLGTLVIRPSG